METYEIHITGSHGINAELDTLGIKNIIVDLLRPDKSLLRTEYMSSFISKHKDITECETFVKSLVNKLNTKVIRIKIESPYYEHYLARCLYLESHFKPLIEPFDDIYPLSRNARSQKMMATDRTYDKAEYEAFREKWQGEDVEMCLADSFVEEDFDWFKEFSK